MVRCASLFSQLIALFNRRQVYQLVIEHRARMLFQRIQLLGTALGIISWRCCFANWLRPKASERYVADWPAPLESYGTWE